jgi:hypothetical protein
MNSFGIISQISPESISLGTISCIPVLEESIVDKCNRIALTAMFHFFPWVDVISILMRNSDYNKSDLLNVVDEAIAKHHHNMTEEEKDSILLKRNQLADLLSNAEFRQYYNVEVEVPCSHYDNPYKTSMYYRIAVSTDFNDGVILSNLKERAKFRRSLGPKYMDIYNLKTEILQDILWLNAKKDSAINS